MFRRGTGFRRTSLARSGIGATGRRGLGLEPLESRQLLAVDVGAGNEPFIVVDPGNPDNVAVGWNFGVSFSTDRGENFAAGALPANYGGDPGLAVDANGQIYFSYLLPDAGIPADLDVGVSTTNFTVQNFSANQTVISNPDNAGNTGDDDDKELIAADFFATSPFQNNVYVAWRELNNEDLLFSRSTNGGVTYSAPTAIANAGGFNTISAADPEVGPNGEVYVGYWRGNSNAAGTSGQIEILKSTDGGVTFGAPTLVSAAQGTAGQDATLLEHNAGGQQNLPNQTFKVVSRTQLDIEADPWRPGNVYAVWATDPDGTIAGDGADVMFSRSVDGGVTWSTPVVLNDDGGTLSQFMPSIGVDEAGNLTVVWYDERSSTDVTDPDLALFATVSFDGGATFSPDFQIAGSFFDPDSGGPNTFIGDYIQVAAADGIGYATWTQTNGGGTNRIMVATYALAAAFPDAYEPNNTIATATQVGSVPEVTFNDLTIHNATDVDFFEVTANATGSLVINALFDHTLGDIDMRLRDEAGNILAASISSTDDEQIVVPVVAQQRYIVEVYGFGGATNVYDLEIENFAVPPPLAVNLNPAFDTGFSAFDNITNNPTAQLFITADLSSFADPNGDGVDEIDVLTPAQVATGQAGVAVEVFAFGQSLGFATPLVGSGNTFFTFNMPNTAPQVEGLNLITAAARVFDPQPAPNQATARSTFSGPLFLTIDTIAPPAPAPDLTASSDSGMFDNDNVTNVTQPAFQGPLVPPAGTEPGTRVTLVTGSFEEIGEAFIEPNGAWQITSTKVFDDGIYAVTALYEDVAGNVSFNFNSLTIEIDTIQPNTPFLDLVEADDTGRSNEDNITNETDPDLVAIVEDPDGPDGHLFPTERLKFRIFDRVDNDPEVLVAEMGAALLINNGAFLNTAVDLDRALTQAQYNGLHNLKLEVEDRAGNLSDDFLLPILLDDIAPEKPTIQLDPASDSGVVGQPALFTDNITNQTTPVITGLAEADAIVRVYADVGNGVAAVSDTVIDGSDVFLGETVAVPIDGNQNDPDGQWTLDTLLVDLNDPASFPIVDRFRQLGAVAEDVAGNVTPADMPMPGGSNFEDIFVDTRGPQVAAVEIVGAPAFDLFALKPDNAAQGPTPLVESLKITFIDQPARGTGAFDYGAVNEILATNVGNYQLIGDHTGPVTITSVDFVPMPYVPDEPAMSMVVLNFAEPLPDDRFTLLVSESISDDVGNLLDGESQAASPFGPGAMVFPSGDGTPGGDFTARFTVDTRPEIGVYAFESVAIDANGNLFFDPQGQGDQTNRDLTFQFGFSTDARFTGNFPNGGVANGFDKLAAYGFDGSVWRFLIDVNDDGVPDLNNPSLAVQGFPVAGNFNAAVQGDEVGLFTGTQWFLDTNANLTIDAADTVLVSNMQGFPIVGDFDGDGIDDLGTWTGDLFSFDLANDGLDGQADQFIQFGFPGVLERPVAHDFDADGIDDIGLYVPQPPGIPSASESDWFFLLSNDPTEPIIPGQVNRLNHPFSPGPLGNDLFASFGDPFSIPIVGNIDPPPGEAAPDPLAGVQQHLGSVLETTLPDMAIDDTWLALTASHDGNLTITAAFDRLGGDVELALYDLSGQLMALSTSTTAGQVLQTSTTPGSTYLLALEGTNGSVTLNVSNNDAPQVSLSGPSSAVPGQPRQFSISASDSSESDQAAGFRFEIDFDGDGAADETHDNVTSVDVTHAFTANGTYPVTVDVFDQMGGSQTVVLPVEVANFALQSEDGDGSLVNLAYGGSDDTDAVFFFPNGDDVEVYHILYNGSFSGEVFNFSGVTGRVIAYGNGGVDILAGFGTLPLEIHGGAGDDRISGSAAADTLFGDEGDDFITGGYGVFDGGDFIDGGVGADVLYGLQGNDTLLGQAGRDLLIGGIGNDVLDGGSDQDLLVAGDVAFADAWKSLTKIRNEWTSSRDYATRVANILGVGTGPKANGSHYLVPGTTVLDDGAVDTLIGGSQLDWFFYNVFSDLLNDHESGEEEEPLF